MTAGVVSAASNAALRAALDELIARVERELQRRQQQGESSGTERDGGVMKVGSRLEEYLRAVARWICLASGLDPEAERKRISSGSVRFDRLSSGALAHMVKELAVLPAAHRPEVATTCAALEASDASISRVIDMRNDIVHGRGVVSHAAERTALDALAQLLRRQRAAL